jgi:hypothetical protein
LAFLASCPECGRPQVCVLGPEPDVRLKCRRCRSVFPADWRRRVPAVDPVEYPDDQTLLDVKFEPAWFGPTTLVVVADLPSVLPKRRKHRNRRRRVPYARPAFPLVVSPAPLVEPEPVPEPLAPEPVPSVAPPVPRARPKSPRPRRAVDDDETPFLHTPLGLACLFLPAAALALAVASPAAGLVRPAAAAGLLLGLIATRTAVREARPLRARVGLSGLAAAIFLASFVAPALLGPGYRGAVGSPPPAAVTVVPYPQFASDMNLRRAEWVNAGQAAVKQGDVRVGITHVWIGPRQGGDAAAANERLLCVRLRLRRDLDMDPKPGKVGWPPAVPDDARVLLTDPAGRPIARKPGPGWQAGRREDGEVGRVWEITLAFAVPPNHPRFLRLELAGPVWGSTAPARFEVPGTLIRYEAPRS